MTPPSTENRAATAPGPYPFATLLRSVDRDRLLVQLVAAVWDSILSLPILPREGSEDLDSGPPSFSAAVRLHKNFGELDRICCDVRPILTGARVWSADVWTGSGGNGIAGLFDAWSELVNMVGGNVKALFPPPTALSLPEVREVETWLSREEATTVMDEVTFACPGERMRLTILKRRP